MYTYILAGYKHEWTREDMSTALVIVALAEAPALWIGFGSIDWKTVGRSNTVVFSLLGAAVACLAFNFQIIVVFLSSSHSEYPGVSHLLA